MRAKAEVVVAEAEGEPLEPNSVDEGEGEPLESNSVVEAEMTSTGQDLFARGARLLAPL